MFCFNLSSQSKEDKTKNELWKIQVRDIKDHSGSSISHWQSFQHENMDENEREPNNIDNSDKSKFKAVKEKYYLEWMCSGSKVLDLSSDFKIKDKTMKITEKGGKSRYL